MAVERCPRDAKCEQATFRPAHIFMHEKGVEKKDKRSAFLIFKY